MTDNQAYQKRFLSWNWQCEFPENV
jgi:hypothetical protein